MACWALTAMNLQGKVILPQEPPQSHDAALGPVRPLVMWSYTNLSDPRLMLGKSFITLTQDPNNKDSEKIGILNKQGWAAYTRNGTLFLKRFAYDPDKTYSDYNVNNETYTDYRFIELESLGPLEKVAPGATITHTENWWLFKNVDLGNDESGIANALEPILSAAGKK